MLTSFGLANPGDSMLARILLVVSLIVASPAVCYAQDSSEAAGKIFSIQGSATVQRGKTPLPVTEGMVVNAGDEVIVGEPGRVAVELLDGSYIRVASGSRLSLPGKDKKVGLLEGALHFFSHSEQHPLIETQQVTAAIRGTEFSLVADAQQTTISMFSGSVEGQSPEGRASLGAGQGATFRKGKAPEIFAILASDRSVQWSMFVPFVADGGIGNQKAVGLFKEGRVKDALATLPEHSKDACSSEMVLRGRMLVSSGDPQAGATILERCAAAPNPSANRSAAKATLSSIRLMQGDSAGATYLAEQAVESDPGSVSARIARSYAYQERGDLDNALRVIEEAGDLSSSELVARRAELLFMFGRVPEARDILAGIPNRSWYAETVYGFVLMADRSFDEAQAAFERAAAEEPAAGLPRVGLGIVQVNRGELEGARKDFERATLLEPSRGLYRSYLAKDYFEDDTYDKAEPEYARAIELDPNDPTPYLYRSFMRVAENNLVGALDDINKARELSNNRDVYRSALLLDQDSAMQSASVARVYQQLGFKERGRIEAITAITTADYMNPTAHRLLSQTQEDIFAADTIASEQRIANLFSPLSINVVDSIGTGVSLNEYSQLFERDGWRTAVNNYFDSQATSAKTGVLSAYKNENIVLGLSADGAMRDGISDDPRTAAGTVGFSLQAQPTWGDRFIFEGRGQSVGDTVTEESTDTLNGTLNAAYLHRFDPNVSTIVQSSYDRYRVKNNRPFYDNSIFYTVVDQQEIDTTLEQVQLDDRWKRYETAIVNEAQLIAKTGRLNSIFTLHNTHNAIDANDKSVIVVDDGQVDPPLQSSGNVNLNGNSASYLGDISVTRAFHLNLGAEYDYVQWASQDEPPFSSERSSRALGSPKAGFVYRPDETIALRAGYGESLGKGSRSDIISIQPTMVGGIIQRYSDDPGTRSQNLGFGGDFKPFQNTYIGSEWSRRWLDQNRSSALYEYTYDANTDSASTSVDVGDNYYVPIRQDFLTAYGYQVLDKHWVGGVDYRFVYQDTRGDDPSWSRDHRGTMFTRYFFADGFFLQGSSTYRYQSRDNLPIDQGGTPTGSAGAWLFGGGLGYRLPTRHGIVMLDVQNIFGQDIDINQLSYFNEPVFSDPTVRLVANFNF
jgi:tetratricopeptide (TPR) repeat protein